MVVECFGDFGVVGWLGVVDCYIGCDFDIGCGKVSGD